MRSRFTCRPAKRRCRRWSAIAQRRTTLEIAVLPWNARGRHTRAYHSSLPHQPQDQTMPTPLGLWTACCCRGVVRHIAMSPGVTDRMALDLRMPLGAYGGSVSCHHRRGYDSSAPMIAPRDRWSVEPMCGNHTVTVLQQAMAGQSVRHFAKGRATNCIPKR